MSLVLRSPKVFGLLSGLVLPPLVTKLVLEPMFIQKKYDEIDDIKYNIDYMGWHVRNLEEKRGVNEDKFYVPDSYFQGRY